MSGGGCQALILTPDARHGAALHRLLLSRPPGADVKHSARRILRNDLDLRHLGEERCAEGGRPGAYPGHLLFNLRPPLSLKPLAGDVENSRRLLVSSLLSMIAMLSWSISSGRS